MNDSIHLEDLGWRQLRVKDAIPEAAGDTKAILVISKVVLEVVLLQFSPVCWKTIGQCQKMFVVTMERKQTLTCGGARSSELNHSKCSQRFLHRRLP